MRCTSIAIFIALSLFLGGCSSMDIQNLQSDLFAWDTANAQRNRDFMAQVKGNWSMNSAAIREFVGPKLQGEEFYKLRYALDELDEMLAKEILTDADVGRGIVLFGKFLDAGGQAIADEVIPKLLALFKQIASK